jgi:hypothetical protein
MDPCLSKARMEEAWQETWTMNPFSTLLSDAILFDRDASTYSETNFFQSNRCAKASFLNAVLSIECAANSCLARIKYPGLVIEYLDKATILDKYQILYSSSSGKDIDRGGKHFQVVKELFHLRNLYVHPKVQKITTNIKLNAAEQKTYEKAAEFQKNSQFLQLPFDFDTWSAKQSTTIVKAVLEFFNHFFLELCKLDAKACSELLSVFVKGPVNTATLLAMEHEEVLKTVKAIYGVEIQFLVFGPAA